MSNSVRFCFACLSLLLVAWGLQSPNLPNPLAHLFIWAGLFGFVMSFLASDAESSGSDTVVDDAGVDTYVDDYYCDYY